MDAPLPGVVPVVPTIVPGRDDLPAVRRAAPSGQVVHGPASVAKASIRGTRGRIRRPWFRQGLRHLACRYHPARGACGSAGVR